LAVRIAVVEALRIMGRSFVGIRINLMVMVGPLGLGCSFKEVDFDLGCNYFVNFTFHQRFGLKFILKFNPFHS